MTPAQTARFQNALLAWYARGHRAMPWRETADPYRIWLAEIMLQQTTVAAVIPYYTRFLETFPTVQALAQANIEDVLRLWAGLGYYRRAHLLHACAQHVTQHHGGTFPGTEEELLTLPGLGPYTAAVVAATAFNRPATVVDGNVERVTARLFEIAEPLPRSKPAIRAAAATLASHHEPRLYANAIMELGATVCTPQNPKCLLCPVQTFCGANASGTQTLYPQKRKKKAQPHHHATAYLFTDARGHIFLRQRTNTGLLASLWELPHEGWEPTPLPRLSYTQETPAGAITHTFTHFKLTLNLVRATAEHLPPENAFAPTALPPLSTLMKKALHTALAMPC